MTEREVRSGPYSEFLSAVVTKRTRNLFKALAAARGNTAAQELRAAISEHLAKAGLAGE